MKEIYENTWAESDAGVRFFLLAGEKEALVIDTGMNALDVRAMAEAHTGLPYRLLNTHADRDHISSNAQFEAFYMHPAEAAFYRNVQGGKGRMIPVFDGDVIDLGGRELEIIHLPGHTPGSITVLDRRNRCLIGGDPIQEDGHIYMFGQHRDMEAYIAGLRRLQKREDFDWILPSHAKERVSREVIPLLTEGAEKILAGTLDGPEIEVHGTLIRSVDAGVCRFLIGRKE